LSGCTTGGFSRRAQLHDDDDDDEAVIHAINYLIKITRIF
jgi:hypothetical protein